MIHFHSQTDEIQTLCVKIILKIIILLIIILTNWQCKHLIHRWAVMSPLHLYAWEIWLLAARMSSESWLRISMDYPNPLWPLTPSRRNIRSVSVILSKSFLLPGQSLKRETKYALLHTYGLIACQWVKYL